MCAALRHWTPERLARQDGKTFVITGANSGIGFEAAKVLVAYGGRVVLACRDMGRAERAAEAIRFHLSGDAAATSVCLDLADMTSVREGAEKIGKLAPEIDALICNAGIMAPPIRQSTRDGFEVQFGVNHLGHFLFAGLLAPNVVAGNGRFVSVSSTMHKAGLKRIRFEDPNWQDGYRPTTAYAQSKLANALFIRELNNRSLASGAKPRGFLCHPGYAATALQTKETKGLFKRLMSLGNVVSAQSAEKGAWPTLLAVADSEAVAGAYYGPTGVFELRGPVGECKLDSQALDDTAAAKLWTLSEELTGYNWII